MMIGRLRRSSCPLLSIAAALLLAGCAGAPDVADVAEIPVPVAAITTGTTMRFLTVNVELRDDGISPAVVAIPAGREVKLVVRNRGTTEHHYQVVGLQPASLWRVTTADAALTGQSNEPMAVVSDEDHAHHHDASLGTYLSHAGLEPAAHAVHAFAQGGGGGMDVLFFTATTPGTYEVICPLHPGMRAKLMVF